MSDRYADGMALRRAVLGDAQVDAAETLLAKSGGGSVYRFNIFLQGENETVFFDV